MSENSIHTINWFELPTKEIARAQKFYETILDLKLEPTEMEGCKMAIFPGKGDAKGASLVHGALIQMEGCEPSDKGAIIYGSIGSGVEITSSLNPQLLSPSGFR